MSLLLDARKKSLQAQSAQPAGDSASAAEQHEATSSEEAARSAGQKLFAAKSPAPSGGSLQPGQGLLLGLGGAALLAAGLTYLWYGNAAKHTAGPPPAAAIAPVQPAAETVEPVQPASMPEEPQPETAMAASAPPPPPQVRESLPASPVLIERQHAEEVDPGLRAAYESYRNGKLDEAQQQYLALYRKDAHNADALLGLAAIARQRGELQLAAQYYAGVLGIDPRNAAANAGMASLLEDDGNNESRLKLLLSEQGNAAVLHFALGNLYAGQSRWGEAQQAYFNAVALEPGNAEFAYNLAVSLDHLGQVGPAAQHYRRALELDPLRSAGFDHSQVSRRIEELSR
jgi:tetratricopeptide (TPR) repeat protein